MEGVRRGARAVMKWFAPLIFVAARSVTVSKGEVAGGRSVTSMRRIVAASTRDGRARTRREGADFVTGVSRSVERFSAHLVAVVWSGKLPRLRGRIACFTTGCPS